MEQFELDAAEAERTAVLREQEREYAGEQDPKTLLEDEDYSRLQDQLAYMIDCGMERSAAAAAIRAKLALLRGSYTVEAKP